MKIITRNIVFVALALIMSASVSASEPPSKPGYNVIIVSIDALQARHLSAYGYPLATTPNLGKFLSRSYLFKNAVSPAPWTIPAHMSIFTSLHPSEHKVVNMVINPGKDEKNPVSVPLNLKELSPSAVTLAEILKRNGYVTAGFTGDSGVSAKHGFSQGFDKFYDSTQWGGFDTSIPKALVWLDKNKDKKFFLFLHGYDVHGNYASADGPDYRFVKKPYNGIYTGSIEERNKLREAIYAGAGPKLTDTDIDFWKALYDEKIAQADIQLGKVLSYMRANELMKNTIIVVLSDHGTGFFEHEFGHGNTLYGEILDVLLAIRIPGQKQGNEIDSLVSTLDVSPTILGLLGIKDSAMAAMKGIDLTPATKGKNVSRDIFFETDFRSYTHKRGIRTPNGWKMILTMESLNRELYNLNNDPGEKVNLASMEPRIAGELERKIYHHLMEMNASEGPWTIETPKKPVDKGHPLKKP